MGNCLSLLNSTNDINYRKDSFSDRICDDLCEVILQYLSLEDKLRLECVSKQFQRTIFQRHCDLELGSDLYLQWFYSRTSHQLPGLLFDRCRNIRKIYFSIRITEFSQRNNIFSLDSSEIFITNNCILNESKNLITLGNKSFDKLICNFAARIKVLKVPCIEVELFTNVEELLLNSKMFEILDIKGIQYKRLRKLSINILSKDFEEIKHFINNNKSIKSLLIDIFIEDRYAVNTILKQVSCFESLIHLGIYKVAINDVLFEDVLSNISSKCSNVKSICCRIETNYNYYYKMNDLLSPLKRFKQLKRLDLEIFDKGKIKIKKDLINFDDFVIRPVTGLPDITHLTFNCYHYYYYGDGNILLDIMCNINKLQYLEIRKIYYPSKVLNEIFYSQNYLEHIKLFIPNDYKKGENLKKNLIKHCNKIRKIEII